MILTLWFVEKVYYANFLRAAAGPAAAVRVLALLASRAFSFFSNTLPSGRSCVPVIQSISSSTELDYYRVQYSR